MNNHLGDPRLRLARLLALVFMLLCLLYFIAGVLNYPQYVATHPEQFTAWGWTPQEMNAIFGRIGLSFHWWIQFNLVMSIVFTLFICGIGFFIYFRKRDDCFSLYVATAFVLFGTFTGFPVSSLVDFESAWEPILTSLSVFAWLAIFLIFYLFPDGRFVPRWTRWAAIVLILSYAIDILVYAGGTPPLPLLLLTFLGIAVGLGSQVYRYRKSSSALQRQQTKWVVFALLVIFSVLLITAIPLMEPSIRQPDSSLALLWAILSSSVSIVLGLIPLSIAFAILRYRLWDIDVIIRKTLVYGGLTLTLALVYFGSVILLQSLVTAIGGQQTAFVTVISTLLIAALFTPLRKRIQNGVDRRFFRKKYDAEKTLDAFSANLRQAAGPGRAERAFAGSGG